MRRMGINLLSNFGDVVNGFGGVNVRFSLEILAVEVLLELFKLDASRIHPTIDVDFIIKILL